LTLGQGSGSNAPTPGASFRYGDNGALISGGRIHAELYRYICEADLADKQSEGLRPIEFIETMAGRHDPWLAKRFASETRIAEA
jgi:hypothetical protein